MRLTQTYTGRLSPTFNSGIRNLANLTVALQNTRSVSREAGGRPSNFPPSSSHPARYDHSQVSTMNRSHQQHHQAPPHPSHPPHHHHRPAPHHQTIGLDLSNPNGRGLRLEGGFPSSSSASLAGPGHAQHLHQQQRMMRASIPAQSTIGMDSRAIEARVRALMESGRPDLMRQAQQLMQAASSAQAHQQIIQAQQHRQLEMDQERVLVEERSRAGVEALTDQPREDPAFRKTRAPVEVVEID